MKLAKSKKLSIHGIKEGDQACFRVVITGELIKAYARLTGDYNPLHSDQRYAKNSFFKKRIAHGMLVSSFFSTLIGMHLPGRNSLIVSQKIKYHKPVYIQQKLEIIGVVKSVSLATKLVNLDIQAKKVGAKKPAVRAEALVLII